MSAATSLDVRDRVHAELRRSTGSSPETTADDDVLVLKSIVDELKTAQSVRGRDSILSAYQSIYERILDQRPDLMKHWLLALDRINRKFVGPR